MTLPRHLLLSLGVAGALLACGHSEPFTTGTQGVDGPFSATPPVRLTYAAGANTRPAFSADGRELLYSFVRGTPDRDRCLGALPAGGGTRTRTLCWTVGGQETEADGLEVGALAADGRLAFTWHSGERFAIVPNEAAVFVTPTGLLADAEKVLDLLVFQPASGIAWDYLLDLTWTGPTQLSALATDIVMINRCPPATCWDTTHVAIDLVTIDVATRPATVTATRVPAGTSGIAIDASTGRRYVRADDRVVELLADGGEATVYAIPAAPTRSQARITGLAVASGRMVVTERFRVTNPPPGPINMVSNLRRVDGAQNPLLEERVDAAGEFGAVTLDPTGRRLVYEGRQGAARHLFLLELP